MEDSISCPFFYQKRQNPLRRWVQYFAMLNVYMFPLRGVDIPVDVGWPGHDQQRTPSELLQKISRSGWMAIILSHQWKIGQNVDPYFLLCLLFVTAGAMRAPSMHDKRFYERWPTMLRTWAPKDQ